MRVTGSITAHGAQANDSCTSGGRSQVIGSSSLDTAQYFSASTPLCACQKKVATLHCE